MTDAKKIIDWAKEIRTIAQNGLAYTRDDFDKERFEALHQLSNEMLASVSKNENVELDKILSIEAGYATPKIAVRAVIMQSDKILMVKEAADGLWTLPGGWCDTGLTASENAIKEVREETGLSVKVKEVIAFFDQTKYRKSITLQDIYTIYFRCEVEGGSMQNSLETIDVGYFPLDNLPSLSKERMTIEQFTKVIDVIKHHKPVYFD